MKEEINSNTIIVGDFNTPLTTMDRSTKQKINKEMQADSLPAKPPGNYMGLYLTIFTAYYQSASSKEPYRRVFSED